MAFSLHRPILPFLLILSCQLHSQTNAGNIFASFSNTISTGQDSALRLLDEALLLMKQNPFRKETIGWDSLRSSARIQLGNAGACSDAHPVIDWCAKQLQLSHSFIMPPKNTALYNNNPAALKRKINLGEVVGKIVTEQFDMGIGYISIPWVRSTDPVTCSLIADSIQASIGRLAKAGASRWIVDLRNNSGGNCWPMLAAVGPLLGNGICGYFVKEGNYIPIHYENGSVIHGSKTMCTINNPVTLSDRQRQGIVVLINGNTSSSGEILALAFRGLGQVRLMGEPTAGFTTVNTTYNLLDGSMLVLTVCREADRTGNICEGKIIPHDPVSPAPANSSEDAMRSAAIMWLQSL